MNDQQVEKERYFAEYVNNIEIAASRFDFSIKMSRLQSDSKIDLGEIFLSPIHAKVLMNILAGNIQAYEDLFGEISMDEPTQEQVQKAQSPISKV